MAYTTVAQVRASTGFTDDTKITDDYINGYITQADAMIDGALLYRYQLPLASTPSLIANLAEDIVIAFLYQNAYGEESQGTDKGSDDRFTEIFDRIEAIRSGAMRLVDSSGDEYATSTITHPSSTPNNTDTVAGGAAELRMTMNKVF
jgi:phage gp36-like protein